MVYVPIKSHADEQGKVFILNEEVTWKNIAYPTDPNFTPLFHLKSIGVRLQTGMKTIVLKLQP